MPLLTKLTTGVFAAALTLIGQSVAAQETLSADQYADKLNAQLGLSRSIRPGTRGLTPIVPGSLDSGTQEIVIPAISAQDQINIRVQFDYNSAALRPDQSEILTTMCDAMGQVEARSFQIIGHTDAKGSEAFNQALSLERADSVRAFLVDSCGIPNDRLTVVGMGEALLLDGEDPEADAQRRVEFRALG